MTKDMGSVYAHVVSNQGVCPSFDFVYQYTRDCKSPLVDYKFPAEDSKESVPKGL